MKLSQNWGKRSRKPTSGTAALPLSVKVKRNSAFHKETGSHSIEEIRSQGQILASRGLGQGVRSASSEEQSTQKTASHPGRGRTQASPRSYAPRRRGSLM